MAIHLNNIAIQLSKNGALKEFATENSTMLGGEDYVVIVGRHDALIVRGTPNEVAQFVYMPDSLMVTGPVRSVPKVIPKAS